MREIIPVSSPMDQDLIKKRKSCAKAEELSQNIVTSSENRIKSKKMKKLKIRLADPQVPDSYVCEMFDSSLEEDETEKNEVGILDDSFNDCIVREQSKPRDFFDVLMSNESRKSFTVNTGARNEEIPEETKLLREIESDDVLSKRKLTKAKNKKKLVNMVKRQKIVKGCSSSSDDDDNIFHIKSSIRMYTTNNTGKKCSDLKAKNKENTQCVDDPSDMLSAITRKRNTNILNYFPKTETRKTVKREKVRPRKLTEIDMFQGMEFVGSNNVSMCEANARDNSKLSNGAKEVKLAPLFQKRVKNAIDPKVQKARMDFLQNGLPTNMKKLCDSRNVFDDGSLAPYFPAISHVQQKDDDPLWIPEPDTLSLLNPEDDYEFVSGNKIFRFEIKKDNPVLAVEETRKISLTNLKSKYKSLNMDCILTGLEEKKDEFVKKMEEASIAGRVCKDDSVEIIEDGEGCNSLWTEVYRPRSKEIMGNSQASAKLSGWLRVWKEYNNEIKNLGKKKIRKLPFHGTASTDDSDDAFLSNDDEPSCLQAPGNVCILFGPVSSGKTALVYALASELEYNVLEVNASSKRTGKKLLVDLQEATKSHQVRNGLALPTGNSEEEQTNKKVKRKKKKGKEEAGRNVTSNTKISLILIEDADVYFEEHDEGFASALLTLVQSSKRPFIFLSNDSNYGYLERLKGPKTLVLEMRRPSFESSCAVLEAIAALEGVSPQSERLQTLIRGNGSDLRKSILELQFWIQSGRNLTKEREAPFDLGRLWWGFNKFLFKKSGVHHLKLNYRKRKRMSEFYDSSSDECEAAKKVKLNEKGRDLKVERSDASERKTDSSIHAFADILDSISVCDLFKLGGGLEPVPRSEYRPRDGLSLSECMESIDWSWRNLSKLIAKELVGVSTRVFRDSVRDEHCPTYDLSDPAWEEIRWRKVQDDARRELTSLVPPNCAYNKRIVHSDYLPVLRNMCRAEKTRCETNTKRRSRYIHYFRSFRADFREEMLDVSCDILDG